MGSIKTEETRYFPMTEGKPLFPSLYTADPAPMVYGDTLYLYTTHDEDEL